MNFKIKAVVAAVAFAAAAHAGAATIDNGAGGNGGLFFNVWDSTGSYTLNLGINLNSFETLAAGASFAPMTWAADSTLSNWIAGKTSYNWNISAVDFQGAVRVLETTTASAANAPKASNIVKTAASQTNALATAIDLKLATANSATYSTTDAGYVGKSAGGFATINSNIGFVSAALGTAANNSFATGLVFEEALGNATGTTKIPYALLGNANGPHAWFDANNTLHIAAAVPEPETYAMFLAGLGLMGAVARRRNRA